MLAKTIFAKTILASPVFTMEKTRFSHHLAKTCQPCESASVFFTKF